MVRNLEQARNDRARTILNLADAFNKQQATYVQNDAAMDKSNHNMTTVHYIEQDLLLNFLNTIQSCDMRAVSFRFFVENE